MPSYDVTSRRRRTALMGYGQTLLIDGSGLGVGITRVGIRLVGTARVGITLVGIERVGIKRAPRHFLS